MNNEAFSIVRGVLPQERKPVVDELTPEQLLARSRVTPETELPPMVSLFSLYDVSCFYRGELVAVCGKAKSGKTLFLSMMMGASLCPVRDEGVLKDLGLIRCRDEPLRVLWIDTEQSAQSTQDILVNRILPLARGQTDSTRVNEIFFAYNLRGMGYEVRRQLMEVAIRTVRPDLVVIDGIKDLMTDINDAVQATLIMEQLMALAQSNNCCIVCVLHQNKSEADHNMRGSIGTELSNKAFEVYTSEYIEERDTFKVSQRMSRRNRIKRKLFYQLGDDGLPVECAGVQEQPRDAQGRWTSSTPQAGCEVPESQSSPWETFNKKYIVRHDDGSYEWNLARLFEDAFEGRTSRPFVQVMGAALRLSHIQDKGYYYTRFTEAEQRGYVRQVKHPDNGETWVELLQNQLPY